MPELERYVVEKYGNVRNFLNEWEKAYGPEHDRIKIEGFIKRPDIILNKIHLGIRICDCLRIDFAELFCNGNIKSADYGAANESVEDIYSLLGAVARGKTLEYMNNMLEN